MGAFEHVFTIVLVRTVIGAIEEESASREHFRVLRLFGAQSKHKLAKRINKMNVRRRRRE